MSNDDCFCILINLRLQACAMMIVCILINLRLYTCAMMFVYYSNLHEALDMCKDDCLLF